MPATVLPIAIPLALALVVTACIYGQTAHAENRARRLLRTLLTSAEYPQLTATGYLEVASHSVPTRTYRIPRKGGRVQLFEQGQLVCELCLQPTRSLPLSDLLLVHKVLLEGDEEAYLSMANRLIPEVGAPNALPVFWACYWYWVG